MPCKKSSGILSDLCSGLAHIANRSCYCEREDTHDAHENVWQNPHVRGRMEDVNKQLTLLLPPVERGSLCHAGHCRGRCWSATSAAAPTWRRWTRSTARSRQAPPRACAPAAPTSVSSCTRPRRRRRAPTWCPSCVTAPRRPPRSSSR